MSHRSNSDDVGREDNDSAAGAGGGRDFDDLRAVIDLPNSKSQKHTRTSKDCCDAAAGGAAADAAAASSSRAQ